MHKLFIVVLYQQSIETCVTINSFRDCHLFENQENFFVFWDNSQDDRNCNFDYNKYYCTNKIEYVHTPENISLAVVYNNCIQKYKTDFVIIFDQDSKLGEKNFDSYLDTVLSNNANINIFLPQIYSKDKLYSPGRYLICKGFHYKHCLRPGSHFDILYTAIMSGTIIRKKFIEKFDITFNELLTLYGIDTSFFNEVKKFDKSYFLLDVKLEHDLSEMHLDEDDKKRRRKTQLEAILLSYKDDWIKEIITKFYLVLLKLIHKI